MQDEPVILLEGGRTVGKSTLLRELAGKHGGRVLDLDDLATRDAVASDPATLLGGESPQLIDEYQHLPEVLDVIKSELNRDSRPGRFIITGSSRHESLPAAAQDLTGRLHRIPIYPLPQAEIDESPRDLITEILQDPTSVVSGDSSRTDRAEYIERVVSGGLLSPLSRSSTTSRQRWFDDYIRLTLERDVQELSRIQQASALPGVLDRLGNRSSTSPTVIGETVRTLASCTHRTRASL